MEGLKNWWIEIWSGTIGCLCWFTPERCQDISARFALIAIVLTLIFITIPRVCRQIKRWLREWPSRDKPNKKKH